MSEHDLREDYDDLHYQGPLARPEVVRWPASIMWVFGLLQLIIVQLWVGFLASILVMTHIVRDNKPWSEVWETATTEETFWISALAWPFLVAGPFVVIRAATHLRRFRRYPLVVAGVILTLLAFPFLYLAVLQLPLGIYLAILLLRRDVRARFEAVARGTITPTSPEASDA